jgi:hypothetical protein
MPVAVPAIATPVFVPLHVPALVASLKVAVAPIQTYIVPVIAAGRGLTVTIAVAMHPVGSV